MDVLSLLTFLSACCCIQPLIWMIFMVQCNQKPRKPVENKPVAAGEKSTMTPATAPTAAAQEAKPEEKPAGTESKPVDDKPTEKKADAPKSQKTTVKGAGDKKEDDGYEVCDELTPSQLAKIANETK
uniref:Uncharacterized protein n=1 Tax=Panagrolaimus sp. JU765 TaxID=591449 RepID=A0AC34R3W7_9BILA